MNISYTLLSICMSIVGVVLVLIILYIALSYPEFSRNLKYINAEIDRTHGREKEYWKRKKRRLYLKFFRFK